MLSLLITYSEKYPDELPEIGIRVEEGELSEDEEEQLVMGLIGAVCLFFSLSLKEWLANVDFWDRGWASGE